MKIKLNNSTHYNNQHIRAFIQRIAKDERPDLCKRNASALHVSIVYRRSTIGSSGYAHYHSNAITIRLPKNPALVCKIDFALVIAHELAHTRGVRHRAMTNNGHYRRTGSHRTIYAWANSLPLDVKQPKRKVVKTADTKLAHAERMLRAAMTREKRAATLRKKWQVKVRYYTRRAVEPV